VRQALRGDRDEPRITSAVTLSPALTLQVIADGKREQAGVFGLYSSRTSVHRARLCHELGAGLDAAWTRR
jgi:hypothetical protein